MRINGCTSMKTRDSYRGEVNRASNELQCRQLYGDTRGIHYETETVVLRSKRAEMGYSPREEKSEAIRGNLPRKEEKPAAQSTIGLFSSSNGKSSSKKYGNGFFNRLIDEMESRDSKPQSKKAGTWSKGVGDNVPENKKVCIERSLSWLENRMEGNGGEQKTRAHDPNLVDSIMGRIKNLMMCDMPHEATSELRQLARELEQLNATLN